MRDGAAGFGLRPLVAQHFRYLPVWRNNWNLHSYMVERVPNSARAQLGYARQLAERDDLEGAIAHLRQSLRIYPTRIEAVARLGLLLAEVGREDEALDPLYRAHLADPGRLELTDVLAGILTRRGEFERAEAVLRRSLEARPTFLWIQYDYGRWLAERGRYREARPLLEQALPRLPDDHRARVLLPLAEGYLAAGDAGRAEAMVRAWLEVRPADPDGAAAALLERIAAARQPEG